MGDAVFDDKVPAVLATPPVAVEIKIRAGKVMVVVDGIFDSHNFGVTLLMTNFLAEVVALAGGIILLNTGTNVDRDTGITATADNLVVFNQNGTGRLFSTGF